jgi:bifunctional UDP-N-acetylglucosamine pyrophosphorylase/glucosamine-1-phosphate N-acetyltransferase
LPLAAVILAAGQGTRMKSNLPKVLHALGGQPMIVYSLAAASAVTGGPPVLVIGHGGEQVRQVVGNAARYVVQAEQLGTGHAVMQAESQLRGQAERVLIFYADMPLLRAETLRALAEAQAAHAGPLSMFTLVTDQPRGFGRIVRSDDGRVLAIVEEAQATPQQKAIREVNPGVYCFDANWLWEHLPRIPLSPKGEYYLTDMVGIAVEEGGAVNALPIDDPLEALGINTRVHLAEAETALRQRINRHWMLEGVTIVDPATTYIHSGVTIGRDTTVLPNTYLWGQTRIGSECVIGPNTHIEDSTLGDRCRVTHSVVEGATLEDDCKAGPFAHLRQGAYLERGVHMGNFGEVKNSRLRQGVKMGHFSYIGDADIGEGTNIGAGTITCNFDGREKHKTVVGRGVFLGSDSMLVAPLTIGDGARTGAGSVVTKDVPPNTLAVGVPARIRKIVPPDDEDSS